MSKQKGPQQQAAPELKEEPEEYSNGERQDDEQEQEQIPNSSALSLAESDTRFLQQLERSLQQTQEWANQLEQEASQPDKSIERAKYTVDRVDDLLGSFDPVSQQDDIQFAIDNALLEQATMIRRMEDEQEQMKEALRARNRQVSQLITKLKSMEQTMLQKDKYIQQLEQQLNVQSKAVSKLQVKYEDEHRVRVVQETLRQPKEKLSVAQQQYQALLASKNSLVPARTGLVQTYQDANIISDQNDFWQTDNQGIDYALPNPKRLQDVVNPNSMWIAKEQSGASVGNKLGYKPVPQKQQVDYWNPKGG